MDGFVGGVGAGEQGEAAGDEDVCGEDREIVGVLRLGVRLGLRLGI